MTEPESAPAQTEQRETPPPSIGLAQAVSSTGPGIFKNVTNTLTDEELTNPAVVKLIMDRMHNAEAQRDEFKRYTDLFHSSDKQVGILKEKLKTNLMNEIMFGVGLTMGGAAMGLVPYFWDIDRSHLAGFMCGAVAVILIVCSIFARAYGSSK